MVTDVIIDGTHYNDYVTGYYGGNMSAFISICAQKNIRAQVETNEITPERLSKCSLLVLAAPAKKAGTVKITAKSDVHEGIISRADSSVRVEVVPTNEEIMIVRDAYSFVK